MRVDHDTSIHDLTDAEAVDLRALCEAMMRRGPSLPADGVEPHGPLFTAWLDVAYPRRSPADFLPMALHALLRRAAAPSAAALTTFSEPDLHAELARRAHARKRKLFGGAS